LSRSCLCSSVPPEPAPGLHTTFHDTWFAGGKSPLKRRFVHPSRLLWTPGHYMKSARPKCFWLVWDKQTVLYRLAPGRDSNPPAIRVMPVAVAILHGGCKQCLQGFGVVEAVAVDGVANGLQLGLCIKFCYGSTSKVFSLGSPFVPSLIGVIWNWKVPGSTILKTKTVDPPAFAFVDKISGRSIFLPLTATSKAEIAGPEGLFGNAKWIVSPTLALLGNMVRNAIKEFLHWNILIIGETPTSIGWLPLRGTRFWSNSPMA
jgi:hypothetical protein